MTEALYRIVVYVETKGVVVNQDTAKGSQRTERYYVVPENLVVERAVELAREAAERCIELKEQA